MKHSGFNNSGKLLPYKGLKEEEKGTVFQELRDKPMERRQPKGICNGQSVVLKLQHVSVPGGCVKIQITPVDLE